MFCWRCKTEVSPEDEYCPECDADLSRGTQGRGSDESVCPECGAEWDTGEDTCPECGASPYGDIVDKDMP